MELSGYLAVARRWWWTLIVLGLDRRPYRLPRCLAIPPTYESQVKVLVGPLNAPTDALRSSGLLVQTYAQYVTTREVLASTIQELGLDMTPDEFADANSRDGQRRHKDPDDPGPGRRPAAGDQSCQHAGDGAGTADLEWP